MQPKRYAVLGAGEVGCHLAKTLSSEGHRVTVIDSDPRSLLAQMTPEVASPTAVGVLLDAAFQVVSIVTTTDFARPSVALALLVGGCAGSTAGGAKIVRTNLPDRCLPPDELGLLGRTRAGTLGRALGRIRRV